MKPASAMPPAAAPILKFFAAITAILALFVTFAAAQIKPAHNPDSADNQDYLEVLKYNAEHPVPARRITSAALNVTNGNDSGAGSLRQAIIDAAAGDTINFNFNGTINITGAQMIINKNLTINGNGARNTIVNRSSGSDRLFRMTSVVVTISNLAITGGRPSANGGGILTIPGGSLTLNGVAMSNNVSDGAGGCVYADGISLTVSNSTFTGNSAINAFNGGCLQLNGSLANNSSVTNSTFSGNTATNEGGAIRNNEQTLTITNTTITLNTTTGSGGGGISASTPTTVRNTIIVNNTHPTRPDLFGTSFIDGGYNFIGKNDGSNFAAGNPNASKSIVGTIAAPQDPQLQPLANNGGQTDTHALLITSPAADKGSSFGFTTDQRGFVRPADNALVPNAPGGDGSDIGAYELQSADLSITKTDAPDPVTAGNNIVYTITISNNGPGDATALTLTDTLPANTTFQSITAPAGWVCTTPAVNAGGTVSCTNTSLANGASATFVLVVNVNTGTANGTISNTATVSSLVTDPAAGNNSSTATTTVAEFVSPAPTGLPPKALLVKPAAGNTTAGGGVSDSSCVAPTGVTVAGVFANINQALGATGAGDTIYVCPKYTANLVVPYVEHVSLGFTNLSVVGISDVRGSRAVIAANPSTATTPTTQLGTNYIVQIVATGVNFGNFVVDGAPGGTNFAGTGIFNGIVVRRSGAFVFNNTVQNIRTADGAANANGQGIAVFGAGSAGSPLEGGTIASPVNILNNIVLTYRSNGVNVSAGSSSAYAFVRGNYIIGNGANSGTVNQIGVQFQSGANGDVFNNRITRILDSVAGCSAAAFSNCSAGIRLNTTASSSANNLRVRFNLISNTQTGIFAQDVQYVSMTSNTISNSVIDGINLRGSAFNLGSNFSTISQNTIFAARRAGIFIGLVGGDASLGNNLTMNTIEDAFTGVANTPPAGNNTIPVTGATANTFISVNNFVGSASSGVNDVQNTNPLP